MGEDRRHDGVVGTQHDNEHSGCLTSHQALHRGEFRYYGTLQ